MPIGSYQIRGVALQPCILRHPTPCESVNGKSELTTRGCEGFLYIAVHMHLPIQRAQWSEIVYGICPHPRKPVSTLYFPGFAFAERAVPIVNSRLGYQSKNGMSAQSKARGNAHKKRRQNPSRELALESFGNHRCEDTVRGRNQHPREADALGLVAVEEHRAHAALQHLREFPAKIDSIADSSIHALTAGGAVNVSGVSQEKCAADPKPTGHAVVNAIRGKPVHLGHSYVQQPLLLLADVLKVQILTLRKFGWHQADQPLHSTRPYREHQRKDVLTKIDVEVAVKATRNPYVGHVKKLLVGSAGKFNSQRLSDAAMGAIATTNVFGLSLLGMPVMQNGGAYLILILSESCEPGTPFDADPCLIQLADQKAFVVILRIR